MNEPLVLGLNLSHNGAACLMRGNEILCAVQEERLLRQKYARVDGAFPALCIDYVLRKTNTRPEQIDLVVAAVQGSAADIKHDIRLNPQIRVGFREIDVHYIGHHLGHAWAAYGLSGFDSSAILVIDGCGSLCSDLAPDERRVLVNKSEPRYEAISIYEANGNDIVAHWKDVSAGGMWMLERFPKMAHFGSLGGMYEAVAEFIFGLGHDAGKVMGLAPYGVPTSPPEMFFKPSSLGFEYSTAFPDSCAIDDRGKFKEQNVVNMAASVQGALEFALDWLAAYVKELSQSSRFCYTGGVALNSVANQRLYASKRFNEIYITAPAEDSGIAIGAAFYGCSRLGSTSRRRKVQSDGFGAPYSEAEVLAASVELPGITTFRESKADSARRLAEGQILALFTGGSEFGPRSLGFRSILCDPRDPDAKDRLNERVKHREPFRPFAPAVLQEFASQWFDFDCTDFDSPFMLRVVSVKEARRSQVPAITHVDGTARVQTVTAAENPALHELLLSFYELTGVPILLNTSFNVMSEPIVETPEEALYTLLENDLDCIRFDSVVAVRSHGISILDLLPLTKPQLITAAHDVARQSHATTYAAVLSTAAGDRTIPITADVMEILHSLDGTKTIDQLSKLQLLVKETALTNRDFADQIIQLRRKGLVTYVLPTS